MLSQLVARTSPGSVTARGSGSKCSICLYGRDQEMPKEPGKKGKSKRFSKRLIHPIVVFPFKLRPETDEYFNSLLRFLRRLQRSQQYLKPVFVVNNQTVHKADFDGLEQVLNGLSRQMERMSGKRNVLHIWSVDSCQMWLAGLGHAFNEAQTHNDVYWLIPGDFHYGEKAAAKGLENMSKLPEAICKDNFDLAVGEIMIDQNNAKQLIDTYATYGLLYNWFPDEAVKIANITRKPRTEFFAIAHEQLKFLLDKRWFPYEQTVFVLLCAVRERWHVKRLALKGLKDDPVARETMQGAMEQIERCERALKLHWRECHQDEQHWPAHYRVLDSRSEEIRRAASTVLGQYLSKKRTVRN